MKVSFDRETWMDVSERRVESLAALPDVDCHLDVAGEGEPPRLTTLVRYRLGLPPYGTPTGQTLYGFPVFVRNDSTPSTSRPAFRPSSPPWNPRSETARP